MDSIWKFLHAWLNKGNVGWDYKFDLVPNLEQEIMEEDEVIPNGRKQNRMKTL